MERASKNCPIISPLQHFQQAHTMGKNGQNEEMDKHAASLSSQKVLGAGIRGLVCLNRLICWYGIGGSRDKNYYYFLFYMHYMYTYLHHTLHSRSTTRNYVHTRMYELPMLTLHSPTRVQHAQVAAYNISKQFRSLPRHSYLGHFSLFRLHAYLEPKALS